MSDCTCYVIMSGDKSRHFKECPKRPVYQSPIITPLSPEDVAMKFFATMFKEDRAKALLQAGIMLDIIGERTRQEKLKATGKFPHSCADLSVSDSFRLSVLIEEVGEAAHDVNEMMSGNPRISREHLREEVVQVAAVAMAWLEAIDKQPV